jgi:hypothetical protein
LVVVTAGAVVAKVVDGAVVVSAVVRGKAVKVVVGAVILVVVVGLVTAAVMAVSQIQCAHHLATLAATVCSVNVPRQTPAVVAVAIAADLATIPMAVAEAVHDKTS